MTTAPYIFALLRTPEHSVFTGVLSAYDDTFTYLAWMRQGAGGRLLMCDLYTSEPQTCEFFLPLWTALGVVARVCHLSLSLVFHIARVLAGLLLLITVRAIGSSFIKSRTRLRYLLWLYAFSAGFGWLLFVLESAGDLFGARAVSGSIDLDTPEAIAFRSVFAQVHFSVGIVLIVGSLALFSTALERNNSIRGLLAGLLVSILAVVHPYLVVVVGAVAIANLLAGPFIKSTQKPVSRRYVDHPRVSAVFAIGAVPGLGYLVYLKQNNSVLQEWLRITDTWSPGPFAYVAGFGLVGIFAIIGVFKILKQRTRHQLPIVIWLVVQLALLYAPTSFQRRLIEGLQVPLCIAAMIGLSWISGRWLRHRRQRLGRILSFAVVLIATSLTNLGFIGAQFSSRNPSASDGRRYVDRDLVSAMDWLKANAQRDQVLFCCYLTGNVAPSMTGLPVYLGHYGQTVRSSEKGEQVSAFFSRKLTFESARALLVDNRVGFVLYGPFERAEAPGFVAPDFLEPAYSSGNVIVFRVR